MDRRLIYAGALPLDLDQLAQSRATMVQFGFLMHAMFCSPGLLDGLACTPTNPRTLNVLVGPGSIISLEPTDPNPYGTLEADLSHDIYKMGINYDFIALPVTPPLTPGYAINYLIEVKYQESDSAPVVLPYYNAQNPSVPFVGPGNSGVSQATIRAQTCAIQIKAGVAAPQTTQLLPSADLGWTAVWSVTCRYGQTSIAASDIAMVPGAPFIANKICVAAVPTPNPAPQPTPAPTPVPPGPTPAPGPTPTPGPPGPTPAPTPAPTPGPPGPTPAPTPAPTPGPPGPTPAPTPAPTLPPQVIYYVASYGSDTANTGTTTSSPWQTLQFAWDHLRATVTGTSAQQLWIVVLDTLPLPLFATAPQVGWGATVIYGGQTVSTPSLTSTTGSITDGTGNIWTLRNGTGLEIFENGSPAGFTANVTLLIYYNATIYQQNSASNWWFWNGTAWVATTDPRAANTPGGVSTVQTQALSFIDSGFVWLEQIYFTTVDPGQSNAFNTTGVTCGGRTTLGMVNCNMGATAQLGISCNTGATINVQGLTLSGEPYSFTNGEFFSNNSVFECDGSAFLNVSGNIAMILPDTYVTNPNSAYCFAFGNGQINISASNTTFSQPNGGTYNCQQYFVSTGGSVNTNGGGPNFLPGTGSFNDGSGSFT